MPRDKTANHIKLMAAARAEFLEVGFEKASMRSIGERCGLTAAGLYRHCRDKEDLFDQLVSPAVERLNVWTQEHVDRYVKTVESSREPLWRDSWIDMMREIVYPNMEDYTLLVARFQGTKRGYPVWDISPAALHLLLSAYSTALFEPVIHSYPLEDAIRCLDTVEAFFLPGWKKLMGF